ncbi:MAG: MFS transporter [Candidatus Hermodarchaeia archaeon]
MILCLAWLGYFSAGMVASSLPPLVTQIASDLGLLGTQLGIILGIGTLMVVPLAVPVGLLFDRINIKRATFTGLLFIALSAFLRTFAINFETMIVFVALFGIGNTLIIVGIAKIIALWFDGNERATATGIYVTGFAIGSGTVLIITNALIVPLLGTWQNAFLFYGLLGFLFAGLWLLLCKELTRTQVQEPLLGALRESTSTLVKEKYIWLIGGIAFLLSIANFGFNGWLPTLLETKGMTPAVAGIMASIPLWIGIFGSITIPRIGKTGSRRILLFILFLIQGIWIYFVIWALGLPLIAVLILYGFSYAGVWPLLLVILMDFPTIGAKYMGTATGLLTTFGASGGFIGPLMVGYLVELTGALILGFIFLAIILEMTLIPIILLREK